MEREASIQQALTILTRMHRLFKVPENEVGWALGVAIRQTKKQIAIKPKNRVKFDYYCDGADCPVCGSGVNIEFRYCPLCGQLLDWNED